MNIRDLAPGSYTVDEPTAAPTKKLNTRDLAPGSYTVEDTSVHPEQKQGLFSKISQGLQKFGDIGASVMNPAAQFAFGSTGKAVGGLITAGIGGAGTLYGQATGDKQKVQQGLQLQESGGSQITPGNIAMTALELYPGGEEANSLLKKLPYGEKAIEGLKNLLQHVPQGLHERAIKQFTEALAPTTKEMKRLAGKIVPEALQRGVKGTLGGIARKTEKMLGVVGPKVEAAIEALPKEHKMSIHPLLDKLASFQKEESTVGKVIVEPQMYHAVEEIANTISDFGHEVDTRNLIDLRRIWDKTIAKSKGFEKFADEITQANLLVKKEASNSIRDELAKEFPNLDKANKEYTFWKRMEEVTGATLERTSSQSGKLRERIGQGVGAVVGQAFGPAGAVMLGEAGKNLTRLFSSAIWKTTSAVVKERIAKAIESGDEKALSLIISKIMVGGKDVVNEVEKVATTGKL